MAEAQTYQAWLVAATAAAPGWELVVPARFVTIEPDDSLGHNATFADWEIIDAAACWLADD